MLFSILKHLEVRPMAQSRGPKKQERTIITPLQGRPEAPDYLNDEATAKFNELTGMLQEAGNLSMLDGDAICLYISHWSRWRKAEAELEMESEVVTLKNGNQSESPWYSISLNCMKQMKLF